MRVFVIVVSASCLLMLGASQVQAAGSCSTFAKIESYDAAAQAVTLDVDKRTKEQRFFPKPEGSPNVSKIPKKCRSSALKQDNFPVKTTGGRMSVTQVRENFSGKMLNDTDDDTWVPTKLQELAGEDTVVAVLLRQPPGSDRNAPHEVTTIYLPITDAELAEIERLENQATDE